MWERLKLDMESFDGKLCIGGNFNTVCYEEERIGRGDIERLAVSFNDFINVLGLMDLPLEGGKFTWCNYKEQAAFSCLDRFLVYASIVINFDGLMQKSLPIFLSDHVPILLGVGTEN